MAYEAGAVDSEDRVQQSSDLYNLANSILAECKAEASLEDLNIAVYLFRVAIDRRPVSHSLRIDLNKNLAVALVTRFAQTSRRRDLDEAISLHIEAALRLYGALERTAGTTSQFDFQVRC
jgi:hypothetical protein